EFFAADGDELEVAEVDAVDVGATGQRDVAGIGSGLGPAGRHDFADLVGAWAEVGEAVDAAGVGGGAGLAGVERVVAIGVEEDGDVSEAGFAGVESTVAVGVVEFRAGYRRQLEVA